MIGIQNMMGLGQQLVLKWVAPRNINFKKITTKFASIDLVGGAMAIFKENCKCIQSWGFGWFLELYKWRG